MTSAGLILVIIFQFLFQLKLLKPKAMYRQELWEHGNHESKHTSLRNRIDRILVRKRNSANDTYKRFQIFLQKYYQVFPEIEIGIKT